MPPLPPRPGKVTEEKPDEDLPERTLREQEGGREALQRAKEKLEAEQEGGRKAVEYYTRQHAKKLEQK